MTMLRNEKGFVLIVALIFLILLTAIGTASIFNATTEIKIAGNTKTASASLYIAESGMEAVKALLNQSAINYFTIDGSSNISIITTGYIYNNPTAALNKTLMYPLYWVAQGAGTPDAHSCSQADGKPWAFIDNLWRFGNSSGGNYTCTDTILNDANIASNMTNNTPIWPIYKDFTVGDQTARVFIDTPVWLPSAPTRVTIPTQSQHINSNPMKKVVANMEIEFGNSLLIFQSFRNGTASVDNSITSNFIIGNPSGDRTMDYGIGGTNSTDRITGIYTGADRVRIRKSTDGGATWSNYALPRINLANGTWQPNTAYTTTSTAITKNGRIYIVITNGTSDATTEPTWPTTTGATVTDGTVTWLEFGLNSINGTFIIGGETPTFTWSANTAYTTTSTPITKNGHIYKVITGGTSHATTEPTWPTGTMATVTDGTVTWRECWECGCMYPGFTYPVNLVATNRFKTDVVSLDTNCQ